VHKADTCNGIQRQLRTRGSRKSTIDILTTCDLRYNFIASFWETKAANDILEYSQWEWLFLDDYKEISWVFIVRLKVQYLLHYHRNKTFMNEMFTLEMRFTRLYFKHWLWQDFRVYLNDVYCTTNRTCRNQI